MVKIYLASSWRNMLQPVVLESLRQAGHEVYDFRNPFFPTSLGGGFQWDSIDPGWERWTVHQYKQALKTPTAFKGFNNDFNAMKQSDVCVLLLPSGRSAHSEAGWFAGKGIPVYVHTGMPVCEPELMYKMYQGITDSTEELIRWLKKHN